MNSGREHRSATRRSMAAVVIATGLVLVVAACQTGADQSDTERAAIATTVSTANTVPASDTTAQSTTTTTTVASVGESTTVPETTITPPVPVLPPITGYGDYTGLTAREIPWDEVNALTIRCLRDQGFNVVPIGKSGISFASIPLEQSRMSEAVFNACYNGLNLPDSMTTRGDSKAVYDFWLEQADCLRSQGIDIPEAPSRETFVESYPRVDWVPYRFVPQDRVSELSEFCPQTPWEA